MSCFDSDSTHDKLMNNEIPGLTQHKWNYLVSESGTKFLNAHFEFLDTLKGLEWVTNFYGIQWLATSVPQRWFKTDEGQIWFHSENGKKWIMTETCSNYFTRKDCWNEFFCSEQGQEWFESDFGKEWFESEFSREYVLTENFFNWIKKDGKEWFGSDFGQKWLLAENGKRCTRRYFAKNMDLEWFKSEQGQNWFNNHFDMEWFEIWIKYSGKEWIKSDEGNAWFNSEKSQLCKDKMTMEVFNNLEPISFGYLTTEDGQKFFQKNYSSLFMRVEKDYLLKFDFENEDSQLFKVKSGILTGMLYSDFEFFFKFMKTKIGEKWLFTREGQIYNNGTSTKWLASKDGKNFLDSPRGFEWLGEYSYLDCHFLRDMGGYTWLGETKFRFLRSEPGKKWIDSYASSRFKASREFRTYVENEI